jgi:hypothetical protein
MINESGKAARKSRERGRKTTLLYEEQQSCYEGHVSVDERQLCCTKSSRAATKELQGSYEYNEKSGAATKDT